MTWRDIYIGQTVSDAYNRDILKYNFQTLKHLKFWTTNRDIYSLPSMDNRDVIRVALNGIAVGLRYFTDRDRKRIPKQIMKRIQQIRRWSKRVAVMFGYNKNIQDNISRKYIDHIVMVIDYIAYKVG